MLGVWVNQWKQCHIVLELEQRPSKAIRVGSMHCPRSVCSWWRVPIKMSQLNVTDLGFRSPKLAGPVDKRNNYEQGKKLVCPNCGQALPAEPVTRFSIKGKMEQLNTFSRNWPWKYKSLRFPNVTQCNGLLRFRLSSKEIGYFGSDSFL